MLVSVWFGSFIATSVRTRHVPFAVCGEASSYLTVYRPSTPHHAKITPSDKSTKTHPCLEVNMTQLTPQWGHYLFSFHLNAFCICSQCIPKGHKVLERYSQSSKLESGDKCFLLLMFHSTSSSVPSIALLILHLWKDLHTIFSANDFMPTTRRDGQKGSNVTQALNCFKWLV